MTFCKIREVQYTVEHADYLVLSSMQLVLKVPGLTALLCTDYILPTTTSLREKKMKQFLSTGLRSMPIAARDVFACVSSKTLFGSTAPP